MRFLTDYADPALTLTLLAAVTLVAAAARWWRAASAWLLASAATLGTILVLKILLLAEVAPPASGTHGEFRSPSGHTASAVLIYGGLAFLLGAPRPAWLGTAVAAGALIGATRAALAFHSGIEVAAGGAIGLAGLFAMARLAGPPARGPRRWALGLASLVAILALHGTHLRLEPRIEAFAAQLTP